MNGPVLIGLLVAMGLVATIYLSSDETSLWPGVGAAAAGAIGVFALDLPWLPTLIMLVTLGAAWAIWRGAGSAIFDIPLEAGHRRRRSRLGADWQARFSADWAAGPWSRHRRSAEWSDADTGDDRGPFAEDPAAPDDADALRLLGLAAGATRAEIKRAHRRLIQRHHPDRGGSTEMAARLNHARERLLQR